MAIALFAETVLTYMIEADSGKADTVNLKVTKIYGTGIAFNKHYIVTTGDVARHSKKQASIVVMINNAPAVARVEHSADTVFNIGSIPCRGIGLLTYFFQGRFQRTGRCP